jgi:hypothetical protein
MSVTWLETREVPVGELTKFPGNAKRGDVKAIRESIRKTGQYRAIVVRRTHVNDGGLIILAGNHTYEAVLAERMPTIRCEILECTDAEARRINLADNRLAELGGYDDDDLATLLAGLNGDFDGTGWSYEDMDRLTDPEAPDEGDAPVDELPTVWGVVIECEDEDQQVTMLRRLDGEGFKVRALM